MSKVAAESVEFPDDEHVALAQGPQAAVEPAGDDWDTWDAGEMQAAVDYLRRKRGLTR